MTPGSRNYRKKPVVIQAIQYTGSNEAEVRVFMDNRSAMLTHTPTYLILSTGAGQVQITPGDWIIRGVKNEYYPCRSDLFLATYEAVTP